MVVSLESLGASVSNNEVLFGVYGWPPVGNDVIHEYFRHDCFRFSLLFHASQCIVFPPHGTIMSPPFTVGVVVPSFFDYLRSQSAAFHQQTHNIGKIL